MRIRVAVALCCVLSSCGSKEERPKFVTELPVVAEGIYDLPRSDATKSIEAAFYVVATADATSTAALPKGAPVVGGQFPGELVALEEIPDQLEAYRSVISRAESKGEDPVEVWRAALAEGAAPPQAKPAEHINEEEYEDDSKDEVFDEPEVLRTDDGMGTGTKMYLEEGKMGKPDSNREAGRYALRDPQAERARLMAEKKNPPPSRWSVSPDAPLLLASASLPASRLFQVASMMCADGVRVGVADAAGAHAVEHRVALGALGADRCLSWADHDASVKERLLTRKRGSTTSAYKPQPFGLVVSANGFVIVDLDRGSGALMSARVADRAALAAALKEIIGDRADEYQLWLRAERDATAAHVVAALDAASDVFQAALVDTTEKDWRGNRLGDYDRAEWQNARAKLYRPQLELDNLMSRGDLENSEIARYMRRKTPRVKACYARALPESPHLAGKLSVRFFISPTGAVLGCAARGLRDDVANCAADVVRSIQFPKPVGGGLVQVWAVYEAEPMLHPRF